MDLILRNRKFTADGVLGEMCDSNGTPLFQTLEHAYLNETDPSHYYAKLCPGTYTCVRGEHRLHDGIEFQTFEIMGVPGHTGILIHVGNYNEDSEGCVLIGKKLGWRDGAKIRMLMASKQAFAEFMEIQKEVDSFKLVVED